MNPRSLLWLLAAGALAIACGPHPRSNSDGAADDADEPRALKAIPTDSSIAASAKVSVDDGVAFTLHVTNIADHSVEITFPDGRTHDFVVMDSVGREVWRWSSGRMFTQSLRNKLLGARETITYEEKWKGDAKPGRYTAIAVLESKNHPVRERVDFAIP